MINLYEAQLYCLQETTHNIGTHLFVSSTDCYWEIWNFFKTHSER